MATVDATDVFVIGGGPAGLAAAIAARQRGLRAIVADGSAPPIDKPCGEGLMAETQAALGDLGVPADDLDGYPIRGIRFVQRDDQVAAAFPKGRGIGIRRTILHEMLVKRAGIAASSFSGTPRCPEFCSAACGLLAAWSTQSGSSARMAVAHACDDGPVWMQTTLAAFDTQPGATIW